MSNIAFQIRLLTKIKKQNLPERSFIGIIFIQIIKSFPH